MLEQQSSSMLVSPWDNKPFQFPSSLDTSSTVDPSRSNHKDPEQQNDAPFWLGGPPNAESAPTTPAVGRKEAERFANYTKMMSSTLPYRRHSLANEPLFSSQQQQLHHQQHHPSLFEKRASISAASVWDSASTSPKSDHFGATIWSPTVKQQEQQQQPASPIWDTRMGVSSTNHPGSSSPQSLFPSRFTFTEPLRSTRRLSLTPLPSASEQIANDYFKPRDVLSSVPEEPGLLPYRRHSLAGPLLGVSARSNASSTSYLREQQCQLSNVLPTSLLSSDLLESVNHCSDQPISWCMVEFKAGRSEIYYSMIPVEKDDWVIVEADRGRDLGKVVAKDLPADQVALLMQSTSTGIWDEPRLAAAVQQQQSSGSTTTPKRVCRLATSAEITLLVTKRQDEQKALLICQTKSKQKKLLMDIVDAEYQWDRRKLTFYFVADRRVDFRELVRELFKIYKTRIWMCSVNTMTKRPPFM